MYSKQQTKDKKPSAKDELHPRAQTKWEELQRRGLIGNSTKKATSKPVEEEKEK